MNTTEQSPPLWLQGRAAILANAQGVQWRKGRPDYHFSDQLLDTQRTTQHAPDSLEATVERLVQVFELEVTHKLDPAQWLSVDVDAFRVRTNGGPWYTIEELAATGTYNTFIGETTHYSSKSETFESASRIFRATFPKGFFWEVLEVYSPPPVVSFQWRHWGTFSGHYKDHGPTGKVIDIIGMSVVRCTEDLKIRELENFYDNHLFFDQLASGCPVAHRQ